MIRRAAYAALLVLIVTSPATGQAQGLRALQSDNDALGWEAVGRLSTSEGYCTATLIAPDLVLSAAHCVYDMSRGTLIPAEKIRFEAGLRNGQAAATREIALLSAHPGFQPNGEVTHENVLHDLALLQLAAPIPTHEIDPFILHDEAVRPGPVSVVSYGMGRDNVQSREKSCALLQDYDGVFSFDCSATFGTSGAPVFSHLNGRGRIMSVISAVVAVDGKRVSIGPHLPPLIADLKRDLRAQATPPQANMRRIRVGESTTGGAKFVRAKP